MKRRYYSHCFIVSLLFLVIGCAGHNQSSERGLERLVRLFENEASDQVLVVAHRGCWSRAPENSLQSIRNCVSIGVDIIELDVRRSLDGVLVLMHDETVDRTTNGHGAVAKLGLHQLKELALLDGSDITPERVPTLREAFVVASGKILINIDAKNDVFGDAMDMANKMGIHDQIIFKAEHSPGSSMLDNLNLLASDAYFMPKLTQGTTTSVRDFAYLHPQAIELKAHTEGYIKNSAAEARAMGARLWINTLSESPEKAAGHTDSLALEMPEKHWGLLIKLGVGIIQTDEPQALLDYLSTRGR